MGLEARKNSTNQYYYRKRWKNGRVVSEYVGAGLAADMAAIDQAFENRDKSRKKAEKERDRAVIQTLNRQLKEAERLTRALTRAAFITNGYHSHKGQWRRQRGNTGS